MNALKRIWLAAPAAAAFLMTAAPASAQSRDEYGEIRQTVARISWIDGSASFSRGDDPDNWQPADRNVPMTLGDRVYTGARSRLELQVHGGDIVRIGAQSDLAALNLTDDTKQFSLKSGIASFRVRRLLENEVWEVDTPNAAVTFEREGDYRVDVDPDGNTRVSVLDGDATVAAGGGQLPLRSGEAMAIYGIDQPQYERIALRGRDEWDRWVGVREARHSQSRSYQYVSNQIVGVDDLDDSGRWEDVPQYGRCWTPTVVAADWAPYRAGHWGWQDPWGWTWTSAEPWGWAPYHYGRWANWQSRWYWVPVAPRATYVEYSPALVAFVGSGAGWSASVGFGGAGFVGWFPLGPRDPFVPWWGARRASYETQVTNVTYVNRTYVTVVNQNTFVSGAPVATSFVRDRAVVQQVVAAPVARGLIPVLPTRESLRVAVRPNLPAPPRPPQAVLSRAVVARVAPPPAPPAFNQKLQVIRENRGAPVAPAAAARISVEERGGPRAVTQVRPVAPEGGRVNLSPRNQSAAPARVEPVAPARGRPMATAQQPVAPAPVTDRTAPARPAPGRAPERGVPERVAPDRTAPPRAAPAAPVMPEARPAERGRPVRLEPTPPVAAPPAERPAVRPETARPADESWRNRQLPGRAPAPAATPKPQTTAPDRASPERQRSDNLPPASGPERGRAQVQRPPAPTSPPERARDRAVPPPASAPEQARPAPPAQAPDREKVAPPERGRPAPQKTKQPEKKSDQKNQEQDEKDKDKQ